MRIEFDPATLSPWADINILLTRMRSLTILAGETRVEGNVVMTLNDDGSAVLALPEIDKPKAKGKGKGK